MAGHKSSQYDWLWHKLTTFQLENGLRQSKQRNQIIEHILSVGGHIDAQMLEQSLARHGKRIGIATIYRTLKFLEQAGVVAACGTNGHTSTFELILPSDHHDHLICLECKQVIEFHDAELERLKEKVCQEHGFAPVSHRLLMYGYCKTCSQSRKL